MLGYKQPVSLLAVAGLWATSAVAQLIPMNYCASINTATTNGNHSIYQSDGLCRDFCQSTHALAIVRDSQCWCSDWVPAESLQTDISDCSNTCPGFLDDTCGGDGLWGYILLNREPAGTRGASSADTPATSTTRRPPASSTEESSTLTPSPSTSVATVTAGGTTRLETVTVMPTITSQPGTNSGNDSAQVMTNQSGLSTGAAVGIAVGVLGVVVILAACAIFFWLRRRKQNKEETTVERSNSGRGSSAGMMSTPRTEMASIWDSEQISMGRRNSRLMPHDPRMDPFAGGLYGVQNKSHESINTIQDNQDYSRKVLRTTNPDPPDH